MADVQFFDPAKEAEVKRRRSYAQQLMQNTGPKPTEVVSGVAVRQSPIEHLARALQMGIAGQESRSADETQVADQKERQQFLADAVSKYGQDPQAFANQLLTQPSTVDAGLGLYSDNIKAQTAATQWEKEANLKRELAAARGGGSIDLETGEIIPGPKKLSATEQKEFFEADDKILSGENALSSLNAALRENDKSYSGWMAGPRAALDSNLGNLFGKETPMADATVNMENLTKTQALESLKTIFGGNPTEGERSVLLDLQASVDKTPEQRKIILERGIALAQKRLGREKMIQQGLSRGNLYQTTPAQTATESAGPSAASIRSRLQGKMAPERIEAYIQSKGFK